MVKVEQLTREEMLEKIKTGERFIGFVFKNEDCFSGFDLEMNTGFDLKNTEEVIISEYGRILVPSGVKWSAPVGYYLSIVPRSGISLKTPIVIANSPGTIEASYRGDIGLILKVDRFVEVFKEWKGIVQNPEVREIEVDTVKGIKKTTYTIPRVKILKYTRLAQCLIHRTIFAPYKDIPVYYCINEKLYEEWEDVCPSVRGSKGYGSTGVK